VYFDFVNFWVSGFFIPQKKEFWHCQIASEH